MAEKIKSLVGCYVRIKREYIQFNEEYGGTYNSRLVGTPFNRFFDDGEISSCSTDDDELIFGTSIPHLWVGRVHVHIYGIDILPYNQDRVFEIKPTSQLIIEGMPGSWTHAWDSKYFDVVKETSITTTKWVIDEEFNNQ